MTRLANAAAQVRMGEIAVATSEGVLRTLLGSCIGLVLYDRRARAGGLAHIVLPDSQGRASASAITLRQVLPVQTKRIDGTTYFLTPCRAKGLDFENSNRFGSDRLQKETGASGLSPYHSLLTPLCLTMKARNTVAASSATRLDHQPAVVEPTLVPFAALIHKEAG